MNKKDAKTTGLSRLLYMFDEVGEDQGFETIPPYSNTPEPSVLGPHFRTLLFSSPHRFSNGVSVRGLGWPLRNVYGQRTICVDLEVCFGSLSCRKIQRRPSFSLLAEADRFWPKISWYLGVHDAMYPNKGPRAFGCITGSQHHRSTTILHSQWELGYFLNDHASFLHQTQL